MTQAEILRSMTQAEILLQNLSKLKGSFAMTPSEIKVLSERILHSRPTELDRTVPRVPRVLTKILLSDEEKHLILEALQKTLKQLGEPS